MAIEFNCLPTIIGSMPHTDPAAACAQVLKYLKDVPAWPQLPQRAFKENMYAQFSEGFPGIVVSDDRIYVDRARDIDGPLEKLYAAYLEDDVDQYAVSADYAAGLHAFLASKGPRPPMVKGHVTGPVSWGLTVTDQNRRSIIYDEVLADAAARLLRLKAGWQEKQLKKISPHTIIFVDEPYMSSFGSAFIPLSRQRVIELLEEVLRGIEGLKGIHCCGNTDWSVILATELDILSFDAYNYAESLSLYPVEVKAFLDRQGVIAWGIVPNEDASLVKETASSLKDRLEEAMAPFARNGLPFKQLLAQSLLTPSCTLASLSEDGAEQALKLLVELSKIMRSK